MTSRNPGLANPGQRGSGQAFLRSNVKNNTPLPFSQGAAIMYETHISKPNHRPEQRNAPNANAALSRLVDVAQAAVDDARAEGGTR